MNLKNEPLPSTRSQPIPNCDSYRGRRPYMQDIHVIPTRPSFVLSCDSLLP